MKIFDYEKAVDLSYYTMCFNETLRIEPPVMSGSLVNPLETTTLGKYTFQKGDQIVVGIRTIHHHKDYWYEPGEFIPERFDHSHRYFLTPSG